MHLRLRLRSARHLTLGPSAPARCDLYTVTINLHVTITTTPLTGGTANVGYAFTFKAAVGTPPYTWAVSAGALPAGITLNSTTGQISGEPKAAGTAHFTIQVTDANGAT